MSVWWAKSVECTASTFHLDNLTTVSTAVHSTKNLLSNHFLASQLHFGTSYFLIACIYWHRRGWGLALILSRHNLEVQLEAGTHLVTVGFSMTRIPRVVPRQVITSKLGLKQSPPWVKYPMLLLLASNINLYSSGIYSTLKYLICILY